MSSALGHVHKKTWHEVAFWSFISRQLQLQRRITHLFCMPEKGKLFSTIFKLQNHKSIKLIKDDKMYNSSPVVCKQFLFSSLLMFYAFSFRNSRHFSPMDYEIRQTRNGLKIISRLEFFIDYENRDSKRRGSMHVKT